MIRFLLIGAGRWVLQCGGPRLGPAVLFWSHLLFLVLLSLALSRIRFVPLRAQHYLLLGIGLTQVSVVSAALVVGWLLVLGWRAERPEVPSRVLFNLRQLLLLAWTVASFVVLFEAVRAGPVLDGLDGGFDVGDDAPFDSVRDAGIVA